MKKTTITGFLAGLLILTSAGCGTGGAAGDPTVVSSAADETSPDADASDAPAEEKTGPWTRYGLPAPGSDRTGVTVSLDKPQVSGMRKLHLITDKSEQQIVEAAVDLYTRSHWDLEQVPTKARPNQYRDYFDKTNNRDYNTDVKKGDGSEFGFTADNKDRMYDLTVSDVKIEAIQDYWPDQIESAEPAAHLRITWTMSFITLPEPKNGKQPRPARYTSRVFTEAAFADIAGDDQMKLIWWKRNAFTPKKELLPVA